MPPRIAIIGAGIAGLYCTKSLLNDGYEVELFEKSGRIGGRMKTDLVDIHTECFSVSFTVPGDEYVIRAI